MWKRFYEENIHFLKEMYEYGGRVSIINGIPRVYMVTTNNDPWGMGEETLKIRSEPSDYTFHTHPLWTDVIKPVSCYPSVGDLVSFCVKGLSKGHLILTKNGVFMAELSDDFPSDSNILTIQREFAEKLRDCTTFRQIADVSRDFGLNIRYVYGEEPVDPIDYTEGADRVIKHIDDLMNPPADEPPQPADEPPQLIDENTPWHDQLWESIPLSRYDVTVMPEVDWADFHDRYRYLVDALHEFGGRASVIFDDKKLIIHYLEKGDPLSIDRIRNVISSKSSHFIFHTHPSNYSYSNFPSGEDIIDTIRQKLDNSQGSFIITAQGIIFIKCKRGYDTPLKIVDAQIAAYSEFVGDLSFEDLQSISMKYGIELSYVYGNPPEGTIPFKVDMEWMQYLEDFRSEL